MTVNVSVPPVADSAADGLYVKRPSLVVAIPRPRLGPQLHRQRVAVGISRPT